MENFLVGVYHAHVYVIISRNASLTSKHFMVEQHVSITKNETQTPSSF